MEYKNSCYKKQRSEVANKPLSDSTLRSYCSCHSSFMADYLNEDQLIHLYSDIQTGNTPEWFNNLRYRGLVYCAKNLNQY
jgi:hypothetical protein